MNLTGKPSVDKPWLKYYTTAAVERDLPLDSIYDALSKENKNFPTVVALNYFNRKITYGELFQNIENAAQAFIAHGVKKDDIVTILAPTLPETIYMFYALAKIGAIANMVDPRTSAEGIRDYIKEVDSKVVVTVDVAADKLRGIKDSTNVQEIITVSPADSLPFGLKQGYQVKTFLESYRNYSKSYARSGECLSWPKFISSGQVNSHSYEYPLVNADDPLVIVHTGGTTGNPKGVVLSHYNVNAAAYQCILAGFDFQRNQSWLNIMPPFIAYGIGNGLHLPLLCGMEVILIPQFKPEEFADLLIKYKPNHMIGVPSHYGHIINSPKLAQADLSYIIAPTVGGDKMDEKLESEVNKFLANHGCPYLVTKGYGMTEVNAAVAACNCNESNEIGSVGIPFPQTLISIFEPGTTSELTYNEVGEVCITGPNTMLGYYKNAKETQNVLWTHEDGKIWVHSGDLGFMNEDGKLFIVDRIKRMIIRHDGFKVFPNLIEDVLVESKAIASCKVVGIRDLRYSQGRLPKAHIVLKPEYRYLEEEVQEELKSLCRLKLPEYAWPCEFEFRKELPLTPIGKIDYLRLEQEDEEQLTSTAKKLIKTKK